MEMHLVSWVSPFVATGTSDKRRKPESLNVPVFTHSSSPFGQQVPQQSLFVGLLSIYCSIQSVIGKSWDMVLDLKATPYSCSQLSSNCVHLQQMSTTTDRRREAGGTVTVDGKEIRKEFGMKIKEPETLPNDRGPRAVLSWPRVPSD